MYLTSMLLTVKRCFLSSAKSQTTAHGQLHIGRH